MSHSKARGFTLIELLIVLVLMGLALSIVLPSMHSQVDKVRYKGEVQRLKHIVEYARYHVYFTNSSVTLTFTSNTVLVGSEKATDKVLRTFNFKSLNFQNTKLTLDTNNYEQVQNINFSVSGKPLQELAL